MLRSVASADVQLIVVDNGGDGVAAACDGLDGVEVLRMERNEGYTRAVNAGARHADGELIVLLNDDCVCDPGFVERITAPIDPAAGVVMAAGVMRDWHDPSLIDSAGMELDRTLLVFDYLNGEPLSRLQTGVPDPIGPSAAAAAFDRSTFLSVGGFDERLFAYWEDVDLVVRLRRLGLRCALAADAIGDHEHSATLGSGSARKNYLMGYGRGYVLRKWQVLNARRLGPVLVREAVLCAGQAIFDRNVAGVRGRLRGYRAAVEPERYPDGIGLDHGTGAAETLRRRARRRSRLRSRPAARGLRTLAVFHLAGTSGPSRSLEAELAWLGEEGTLDVVIPGPGQVGEVLGDAGGVIQLDYEALTKPDPGARGLVRELRRLSHDVARLPARDPRAPPRARDLRDDDAAGRPDRRLARARAGARLLRRALRPRLSRRRLPRAREPRAGGPHRAPLGGDRRLLGHGRGPVHQRLGEGRDRLPARRRALLARRRRPPARALRHRRRRAGARLGRQPHRGPRPGRPRAGDAVDPRAAARRPLPPGRRPVPAPAGHRLPRAAASRWSPSSAWATR